MAKHQPDVCDARKAGERIYFEDGEPMRPAPKAAPPSNGKRTAPPEDEAPPAAEPAPKARRNKRKEAEGDDEKKPSAATRLLELVERSGAELWHTSDDQTYVDVRSGDYRETHAVGSGRFRRWLAHLFYRAEKSAPGAEAIAAATAVLEGRALFEGPERVAHVRVAGTDERVWIDLADSTWQAIEIDADGWRVVRQPEARYFRGRGMQALPQPERGGAIDELRRFVHVADDDWPLVVAWLVGALQPRGPYPALELTGPHGSGKTSATKFLRRTIDPNASDARCEPESVRDMLITASLSWIYTLENVSSVKKWFSDALCRLSTGGGAGVRELYTDRDETIFEVQRPTVINGIVEAATQPDLIDRCIAVELLPIDGDRKREGELWPAYDAARPRILGALCDGVVAAIRNRDTAPEFPTRMCDFLRWAVAAEESFGFASGTTWGAYQRNREGANDTAIECSPVATALLTFMGSKALWSGSVGELLEALNKIAGEDTRRRRDWPQSERGLGAALRRVAPNLRATGLVIETPKERQPITRRRMVHVSRTMAVQ